MQHCVGCNFYICLLFEPCQKCDTLKKDASQTKQRQIMRLVLNSQDFILSVVSEQDYSDSVTEKEKKKKEHHSKAMRSWDVIKHLAVLSFARGH